MTKEAAIQDLPTKRWTVAEYHRMIAEGFLTERDHVELLFGHILPMTPVGKFHASTVKKTAQLCRRLDPNEYIISVQDPITDFLSASEPEPDICILKYREDFYASGHPDAEAIVLLIEVADTSLEYDRIDKASAYAKAGIGEYWILNCNNLQLEQHLHPLNGEYQEIRIYKDGQTVETNLLGSIHVKSLFPFA